MARLQHFNLKHIPVVSSLLYKVTELHVAISMLATLQTIISNSVKEIKHFYET